MLARIPRNHRGPFQMAKRCTSRGLSHQRDARRRSIDNSEPPTPAVSVTSSHWPIDMSGIIVSTANITGMLSTIAENSPTAMLALVAPNRRTSVLMPSPDSR